MRSNQLSLEKMNVNVHQCAWCLRVADGRGEYTIASDHLVNGSHGICAPCAKGFLTQARADSRKVRLLQAA